MKPLILLALSVSALANPPRIEQPFAQLCPRQAVFTPPVLIDGGKRMKSKITLPDGTAKTFVFPVIEFHAKETK